MDSLLEKLCQYLETASAEEKRKGWNETFSYGKLGPTVEEYDTLIDYYKPYFLDNLSSKINFIQANIGQEFNSDLFYI